MKRLHNKAAKKTHFPNTEFSFILWRDPYTEGPAGWQWLCSNKRIMMFCSDWISTNKAHCCYNEHKRVPKCRKNSARNEWVEIGDTPRQTLSHQKFYHHLQLSHIHHHPPRDIEEGKRFNIWVSLLVRIVNLVLLDGRIHVTHKSGFVWTMDKKFWMERAGNEGKFAFVTLLCLSCSQY